VANCVQKIEVQDCVQKYKIVYRVKDCVQKYKIVYRVQDCVQKYRIVYRSTGLCTEVQDCVQKYRMTMKGVALLLWGRGSWEGCLRGSSTGRTRLLSWYGILRPELCKVSAISSL